MKTPKPKPPKRVVITLTIDTGQPIRALRRIYKRGAVLRCLDDGRTFAHVVQASFDVIRPEE